MMSVTRALLITFALTACKPAPPEVAADPQSLAAPFDAAELRAGLPVGTRVRYRMSTPDGTAGLSVWEVVRADELGLTTQMRLVDEQENDLSPPGISEKTWEEMVAESQPKEGDEVMGPERQQTALGTLRVMTIIVSDPEDDNIFDIRTYSLEHPGPLIKQESIKDGERMFTAEAIEWTVGPRR
jgi:hypothetical protein